jgi:hypothetical protein
MKLETHTLLAQVYGEVPVNSGVLIAVAILAVLALVVGFWMLRRK